MVFPDKAGAVAEMRRVPQFGKINVKATLLNAPVKYRQNVVEVPLESIVEDSPFQTRRRFDPEAFEEDRSLVESIQTIGQWEPVCLQAVEQGQYRTVYGHRRIAALRYLNAETMLAIIIQGDLAETATWTAIENTGVPLSPIEKAELARHLSTQLGMNTADISLRLCVSQRYVQYLLKVTDAVDAVRLALRQETISIKAAYEVALAPKEHQLRLVEIAVACRLQSNDCARVVKRLTDDNSSPDEAATACGFALRSEPAQQKEFLSDTEVLNDPGLGNATQAHNDDDHEVISDSPEPKANPLAEKFESSSEGNHQTPSDSPARTAKTKFDPAATTKMLLNEMTTVDKAAVRTIAARGIDRRLNQRDLRVAVLLAGNTTPAKALDNAEALANDPTARLLAEMTERIGRIRDRVQRRQHNGLTAAMLQALVKECQALAGETRAARNDV